VNELTTDDLRRFDWGDAQLCGFSWEKDGLDLRLFLEHASQPIQSLLCHGASELSVPATWKGPSLSWSGTIEPAANGRWRVSIDLASSGDVTVECENVTAILEAPGSPR
jgi:hypothetical protein